MVRIAAFDVFKTWQFSKYNVWRDTVFEFETLMGTHQVKEVGTAISHDPSRSQLAFHHKASISSGLLEGQILSLRQRQLWPRIRSKDVRRLSFGRLPRSQQVPMASHHKASIYSGLLEGEILSLRRRHLWARIGSKDVRRVPLGRLPDSSRSQWSLSSRLISLVNAQRVSVVLLPSGGRWNNGPSLALLPLRHKRGQVQVWQGAGSLIGNPPHDTRVHLSRRVRR